MSFETLREGFQKNIEILREEEKWIEREQQLVEIRELKELVKSLVVGKSFGNMGEHSNSRPPNANKLIIEELFSSKEEEYYSKKGNPKKNRQEDERKPYHGKIVVDNPDSLRNQV